MKKVIMDANEACSYSSYMFTEACGIYPITPSSPMAEKMEELSQKGHTNIFGDSVKVIEMQSEAGAAGLVHGLLKAGILTSTYTASQGLLLMIPNMYKMSGEMLPCVMHVAARSLSTHALSILGDHQDVYAVRQTGFCMLASSSVQDSAYLSIVAHLASIKSSLPFLHFFDGFRTSHELNKINILEKEDCRDLLDLESINNFKQSAMNPHNAKTYGTNQNDDIYFQATEIRNKYYDKAVDNVIYYMDKINKKTNSDYKPFNYYGSKTAKKIIVAMGSVCETIKETIDFLNEEVGLIEVHLYRPFSKEHLINVLPKTVLKVAVIDRTKEMGSREPLYLDVCEAFKNLNLTITGGRYGLSSKNTNPSLIKAVYDSLDDNKDNFTIGINDDVTNLSLNPVDIKIKNSYELLIYGYGSDGMVSASKSLIKMIGSKTDKYVQGYFQYDSKKSGGVTKSHLRISSDKIRSTYYVDNPDIVVVTEYSYLCTFNCLENISDGGIFLLNTSKDSNELIKELPDNVKNQIVNKNIKFYIINADLVARQEGLDNKISTILECSILKLIELMPLEEASKYLKEEIFKKFGMRDMKIVEANNSAIDKAVDYLNLIEIKGDFTYNKVSYDSIYENIKHGLGDSIPVSSFINIPSSVFEGGTSKYDKRAISDIVPCWINKNCIKCNMCSFVCPHSVIRPFELNESEYDKAPQFVKDKCINNYIIGISVKDCTGCSLCINSCLSKEKSLITSKLSDQINEQEVFDYLVNNISCKEKDLNNFKNIQFKMPKIEFNGACAGCSQPSYIKLLTQLFGDSMMIANATGCSSIYGASMPSLPYNIPWASSLFEDNAEFGFGMVIAEKIHKEKIINIMKKYGDFDEYINNSNNYEITKKVYEELDFNKYPLLKPLKDNIISRSIWTIGGDGWAYDIGFSGIDHVMSNNYNAKILVLDTQVYSNTGGQASKATPLGSTALFATNGKETNKKDLARMMMCYSHAYIAQVSLSNPAHLIKVFKEANEYNGPVLILAYSPCIAHGIEGGMSNSFKNLKEAVECGYFPLFKNHPLNGFSLDSKANFDLYYDFLNKQMRYKLLIKLNKNSEQLLKLNKENAIKKYEYLEKLTLNR